MNLSQARVAQVDNWEARHNFPYRTDGVAHRRSLMLNAVEVDHAEALEMNSNGDASEAAFNDANPFTPEPYSLTVLDHMSTPVADWVTRSILYSRVRQSMTLVQYITYCKSITNVV